MAIGIKKIESYTPAVKYNQGTYTALPISTTGNLTVGGTITSTGAISGPSLQTVTLNALVGATVVLTAAQSGSLLINRSTSGTPSWTLPTAAAGLWFDFLVTSTTAGFTVTGGTIFAKANPNGASVTGTTLTNTQGTAVVGDFIRLVCDGTSWRGTAQTGIFAAS